MGVGVDIFFTKGTLYGSTFMCTRILSAHYLLTVTALEERRTQGHFVFTLLSLVVFKAGRIAKVAEAVLTILPVYMIGAPLTTTDVAFSATLMQIFIVVPFLAG